jgi:hypothetical protein
MTDGMDLLQLVAMAVLCIRVAFPPRAAFRTKHPLPAVILFRAYAALVAVSLCVGLTAQALGQESGLMLQSFARMMLLGYVAAEVGLAFEFPRGETNGHAVNSRRLRTWIAVVMLCAWAQRSASAQQRVDTAGIKAAIRFEIRRDRHLDDVREVDSAEAEQTFFRCLGPVAKRPATCGSNVRPRILQFDSITVGDSVSAAAVTTVYAAGSEPYAFMYSESRWKLTLRDGKWTAARTNQVVIGDGFVNKDSIP